MDFTSFSHGQIHSKVWLCEHLEPYLKPDSKIIILGCWYNVLGFILMVRNPHKRFKIRGIDINKEVIPIANSLTEAWGFEEFTPFVNECADANNYNFENFDVIINTSVEHMDETKWFDNIPKGKLVCLQSIDLELKDEPIFQIVNSNPTKEIFLQKFNMTETLFYGEKHFDYKINPYTRFCHIGYK